MQVEITKKQERKIRRVFGMSPQDYVDAMIPLNSLEAQGIKKLCERYFKTRVDIKGSKAQLVKARYITMTLLHEYTGLPAVEVAGICGERNHTRVTHAKKYVYQTMCPHVKEDYTKLKIILNEQ